MKRMLSIILMVGLSMTTGIWLEHKAQLTSKLSSALSTLLGIQQPMTSHQDNTTGTKEKAIKYWVAPMDPNYRRDKPGNSPMGMSLVPVYDNAEDDPNELAVKISPAVAHNLGVRTSIAIKSPLGRQINTVGYVAYDENQISHIHLRTKGWIEKLYVKAEGEKVEKDQLLFELYSPNLVNAQEEYIQVLSSGNKSLIRASGERLRALGITPKQVKLLRKNKKVSQQIKIFAPQNGVISKLNIREGMHVKPATVIMSIVDLSSVWLMAEVFERQTNWVKTGQSVAAELTYLPGKIWTGNVDYIYPDLDKMTRTLKVRLKFNNPEGEFKPNMYAHITIFGHEKQMALNIPKEALIRSGHGNRVIIQSAENYYLAQKVVTGIESGDRIEIKSGLREGDRIVTSAQFLIDSEASLKASFARMTPLDKDEMPPTAMQMEPQPSIEAKVINGAGTVNSVMASTHKINITHEPIEALGWPTMTMDFDVAETVKLDHVKAGDSIHFSLKKMGKFSYQMTFIHRMSN